VALLLLLLLLLLLWARRPKLGPDCLIVAVPRSHTIRHTHAKKKHTPTHIHGRTPLNEWSARRRDRYLHNTQLTQRTTTRASSGIRTLHPRNQAVEDLHLWSHGHRDRQYCSYARKFLRPVYVERVNMQEQTCKNKMSAYCRKKKNLSCLQLRTLLL